MSKPTPAPEDSAPVAVLVPADTNDTDDANVAIWGEGTWGDGRVMATTEQAERISAERRAAWASTELDEATKRHEDADALVGRMLEHLDDLTPEERTKLESVRDAANGALEELATALAAEAAEAN